MLRWFYANEELICQKKTEPDIFHHELPPAEIPFEFTWRFCVMLKDWNLLSNEVVAITGDCDALGNWDLKNCFQMEPDYDGCSNTWNAFVNLSGNRDIAYRYLIIAIDPTTEQKIVRFFESHLKTRIIPAKMQIQMDVCEDIFGFIKDEYKVERGWLTTERIIQFMFTKAHFSLHNSDVQDHTLSVKVTPYFRKGSYKCIKLFTNDDLPPLIRDAESKNSLYSESKIVEKKKEIDRLCKEKIPSYTKLDFSIPKKCESEQNITENISELEESIPPFTESFPEKLSTAFAFNEAVNTGITKGVLGAQPEFGTKCNKDDVVTIHLTIGDFNNTVYLIEIFMFSKFGLKEHPYRLGYRYVLPEDFSTYKQGYMEIPVICESKHRPMGFLTFLFLIIDPIPKLKFDLSSSNLRRWQKSNDTIIIGHRGMGKTFVDSDELLLYENTIFSMNRAVENGVQMIEFDVHMTKDLIPIVYHDFNVHVSLKDQKLLQSYNHINIPIGEFTYSELKDLKIYEKNEAPFITRIGGANTRLQLFPKLSEVLDGVDEQIAMDIEIKSPQQFCGSKWEEDLRPLIDHNTFVDRVLEVVLRKTSIRRVMFSSFDADIVTLLRFKQNRFPVMLNINSEDGPPYIDPRVRNPSVSVSFAHNIELLGVVFKASTILQNPIYSKKSEDHQLLTFAYGIENFEDIKDLKHMRVNGVILDRVDNYFEFIAQNRKNVTSGDGDSQQTPK